MAKALEGSSRHTLHENCRGNADSQTPVIHKIDKFLARLVKRKKRRLKSEMKEET